jgi:hypothetical protein
VEEGGLFNGDISSSAVIYRRTMRPLNKGKKHKVVPVLN